MKRIILLAFLLVSSLTTKGLQQLSYTYDAAGNCLSRTIVAGAHNAEGEAPRTYMDTIGDRPLVINSGSGQPQLTHRRERIRLFRKDGEIYDLETETANISVNVIQTGATIVKYFEAPYPNGSTVRFGYTNNTTTSFFIL